MFSEGIDINVALVALYSGRQLAWLNVVFCSALPAAVYKVVALQSPGVQPSSDQARGWRADEDEERPLVLLDSISGTGTTIWTALTESWTASVAPSAAFRQAWGQLFCSSALRRPWQFSKASSWLKSRQLCQVINFRILQKIRVWFKVFPKFEMYWILLQKSTDWKITSEGVWYWYASPSCHISLIP